MNTLFARVALGVAFVALLVIAVVSAGVLLIGRSTFESLMAQHGASAALSYDMFDSSVTRVLIGASVTALAGAAVLAGVIARSVSRPLADVARAARRIAGGSYDTRVKRPKSRELASLADSFNQMAASLQDHERQRNDLILNFAHELRTPLTNLHGYLQALDDGYVVASSEAYASLQEEIDRLIRLSRSLDVLADGTARPHELVELDLVPVVEAVLELNRHSFARRHLTVQSTMPPSVRVRAEPDALAQVLANLMQNATRYTPEGGQVWIRAELEGDTVVVSVTNTGDQIPADDLPHLFERFYRVEKSRSAAQGGAGVGLAVVKELVETAGGKVGVSSGHGTTRFWFSLSAAAR